jgi:putative heme degradation protein
MSEELLDAVFQPTSIRDDEDSPSYQGPDDYHISVRKVYLDRKSVPTNYAEYVERETQVSDEDAQALIDAKAVAAEVAEAQADKDQKQTRAIKASLEAIYGITTLMKKHLPLTTAEVKAVNKWRVMYEDAVE